MEDLEVQLLELLRTNWKVDVEKTVFHRNMRRVEAEITAPNVIVGELADVNDWSNEGMADCRAVVVIRIRFPCEELGNEALETAKAVKHSYRNQIYKILYRMTLGLYDVEKPEGWEWAFVTRRINEDNFDTPHPFLGEALHVTVAYQRTVEGEE